MSILRAMIETLITDSFFQCRARVFLKLNIIFLAVSEFPRAYLRNEDELMNDLHGLLLHAIYELNPT